jgi:hypothetical protein
MLDFEDEIDVLENVLSNIEAAIGNVKDSPYHSYMAQSWELDKEQIESRLEELYELQNDQWTREMKEQSLEYQGARI